MPEADQRRNKTLHTESAEMAKAADFRGWVEGLAQFDYVSIKREAWKQMPMASDEEIKAELEIVAFNLENMGFKKRAEQLRKIADTFRKEEAS